MNGASDVERARFLSIARIAHARHATWRRLAWRALAGTLALLLMLVTIHFVGVKLAVALLAGDYVMGRHDERERRERVRRAINPEGCGL